MIKKFQKRYPKRVFAARQITGKPLTLSQKSFILTFGTEYYLTFLKQDVDYVDFTLIGIIYQECNSLR